jgi:two-component sensor histidine kinase
LEISDNGVGLPDDFNSKKKSLGMNLIRTLTSQLDAEYNFSSSGKGTTFAMQFTKEERKG